MIDNGKGVLWIRGKFKDNLPNPYFRVSFPARDAIMQLKLFFTLVDFIESCESRGFPIRLFHVRSRGKKL